MIAALVAVPALLFGCGSSPQLKEIEAARAQLRSERVQAEQRAKQFDDQRRATMEELEHKLNLIRLAQRDFEEMVAAKSEQINALTKHAEERTAAAAQHATRSVDAIVNRRLTDLRLELLNGGTATNERSSTESLQKLLRSLEARDRLANHGK